MSCCSTCRATLSDSWRLPQANSSVNANHRVTGTPCRSLPSCWRATTKGRSFGVASERLEIICVDDGSTDGMNRELRRLRDERLIDAALATSLRCGKSSACNFGISRARGEIVVITDCDCTFDRD